MPHKAHVQFKTCFRIERTISIVTRFLVFFKRQTAMISWSPLAQSNFAETTDEIPSGFLSFEFLRFGVATPVFV